MGNQIVQPENILQEFHRILAPKTGQKKYTLDELFNAIYTKLHGKRDKEDRRNLLYFFMYFLQEHIVPLGHLSTYKFNFYGKFEGIALYKEFLKWYKNHTIFSIMDTQFKRRTRIENMLRTKNDELKILKDNNEFFKANKKYEEIKDLEKERDGMLDLNKKKEEIVTTFTNIKDQRIRKLPKRKHVTLKYGTRKEQNALLNYDDWISQYFDTEKSGFYDLSLLKKYLSNYGNYLEDETILTYFLEFEDKPLAPHDHDRMNRFLKFYREEQEQEKRLRKELEQLTELEEKRKEELDEDTENTQQLLERLNEQAKGFLESVEDPDGEESEGEDEEKKPIKRLIYGSEDSRKLLLDFNLWLLSFYMGKKTFVLGKPEIMSKVYLLTKGVQTYSIENDIQNFYQTHPFHREKKDITTAFLHYAQEDLMEMDACWNEEALDEAGRLKVFDYHLMNNFVKKEDGGVLDKYVKTAVSLSTLTFDEEEGEEDDDETTDDEEGEWMLKEYERQQILKKTINTILVRYFTSAYTNTTLNPNDPDQLIALLE